MQSWVIAGVFAFLVLVAWPIDASALMFPADFFVEAGGGSQTGNLLLSGPTGVQPTVTTVSGHGLLTVAPSFGFADILATADYGLLQAQASASTTFFNGLQIEMEGSADASFMDTWMVTPAATGGKPIGTPVTLMLTAVFSASIGTPLGRSGGFFDSQAHLQARVGGNIFCPTCPPDLLLKDTSNVNQPVTEVQSIPITVEVGGSIAAFFELVAQADSIPDITSQNGFTLVDAAHSAKVFLDAPPGVLLVSGSGHDYSSTAAVPTPEPGTLVLLALGLVVILAGTRRRVFDR